MTTVTTVTIRNAAGVRTFRIRSEGHTPEHVREVLGGTMVLGCGLLDAVYHQADGEPVEDSNGVEQG